MKYPRGLAIIFSVAPYAKGLYARKKRLYMHQADSTGRSGSASIGGDARLASSTFAVVPSFPRPRTWSIKAKGESARKRTTLQGTHVRRRAHVHFGHALRSPHVAPAPVSRVLALRGTLRDFALYVFIPGEYELPRSRLMSCVIPDIVPLFPKDRGPFSRLTTARGTRTWTEPRALLGFNVSSRERTRSVQIRGTSF